MTTTTADINNIVSLAAEGGVINDMRFRDGLVQVRPTTIHTIDATFDLLEHFDDVAIVDPAIFDATR